MLMLRALGWLTVVVVGVVLVVNGLFMLASPQRWFRLPNWIRAQGSLTEAKYGSGWGAFQVRFTGAAVLGIVVFVLYESLLRPR
jgi:hypothetical protein